MADSPKTNPLDVPGSRMIAEGMQHARAFYELAALGGRAVLSGNSSARLAVTPNLAFAAELYLKVLSATQTGSWPRGHELAKLFNGLPAATRQELERRYDEFIKDFPTDTLPRVGINRGISLPEVLAEASDAFAKLRYGYESAESTGPRSLPDAFGLWWFVELLKPYIEALPMPGSR